MKGRLQHLLKDRFPRPFHRNYDLKSIGSTKGEKVEQYVASQLRRHPLKPERLKSNFADLQIVNPEVDLLEPRYSAHGRHTCNLHLVFVRANRNDETNPEIWIATREMIRAASSSKGHLLSCVGIVPDHLHMTIGISPNEVPRDVALSYMNNIAFAQGMRLVLMHSCYLAGFGPYDLGAIRTSS